MSYKKYIEQLEKKRRSTMIKMKICNEEYLMPFDAETAPVTHGDDKFVAFRIDKETNKIQVCYRFYENVWMDFQSIPNTSKNLKALREGKWCDPNFDWFDGAIYTNFGCWESPIELSS